MSASFVRGYSKGRFGSTNGSLTPPPLPLFPIAPLSRNCSVSKAETASRQGEITEKFRWMHGEEELRQIRF